MKLDIFKTYGAEFFGINWFVPLKSFKFKPVHFLPFSNLNKRLSISTVCISSATSDRPHHSESDCLTDGSVAERIKNFMSKAQKGQNKKNDSTEIKPLMKLRPRSSGRSMQDLSNINNNTEQPAYVTRTLIGKIAPTGKQFQGGVDSAATTPKATTK